MKWWIKQHKILVYRPVKLWFFPFLYFETRCGRFKVNVIILMTLYDNIFVIDVLALDTKEEEEKCSYFTFITFILSCSVLQNTESNCLQSLFTWFSHVIQWKLKHMVRVRRNYFLIFRFRQRNCYHFISV